MAADAASQQFGQQALQPTPHMHATSSQDIATLLSDYAPQQDPKKPHYLSDAQVAALNSALANFFGLKFPGLLEQSQR
jgi:hypothetical protein